MNKKRKLISGIVLCIILAISFSIGYKIIEKSNYIDLQTNLTEELPPSQNPESEEESEMPALSLEISQEDKISGAPTPEAEKPLQEKPEQGLPEKSPEPAAEIIDEEKTVCTLSVRCDSVLKNLDKLAHGKAAIIPKDGIIFAPREVSFSEGESVFDVLYRELKNSGIHFEFVKNPMYDSAYIEGINNLYEFDCGDLSGWLYKVNGKKPTYGCSQYKIQSGDNIEFLYSCNFLNETE